MYHTLYQVICNSGDGSSHLDYTTDTRVVAMWQSRADSGDEQYASGEGLQCTELKFTSANSRQEFMQLNNIHSTTPEDFDETSY